MVGGNVIAIAGVKGGVGKTTTCINLASALQMVGREVLVVELDLAMANVLDFLDVEPSSGATVHDVLSGDVGPAEAIYEAPGGFDVAPSGVSLAGFTSTDLDELPPTVSTLRSEYDLVLLDTGAGVSYETLLPVAIADGSVLVTTPRAAAVRDTMKTKELVERVGGSVRGLLVVKTGTGTAPSADRIADFLGVSLLGEVPHDDAIAGAQDRGVPILRHDFASRAAKAYWDTARRLSSDPRPDVDRSAPGTLAQNSTS